MSGDDTSPKHFRNLIELLLSMTVMDESSYVRLLEGSSADFFVLGGPQGPIDPLILNDGRQLRVAITLMLEAHEGGRRLKVFEYEVFNIRPTKALRFSDDYLRNPKTHHPASHLQVHAKFSDQSVHKYLHKVHFPAGRIALEGVIPTAGGGISGSLPCPHQDLAACIG